jgi:ketosteroid isomerase-like protein
MNKLLLAFAMTALAAGPTFASEKSDVMVPVHQFTDGFNKGDIKSALAACAEQTSIIDEFPPHEWHGDGACANWANDFVADAKKNGNTDTIATLGKARHIDISGDRAYVVVPVNLAYKQHGKPHKEIGSTLTIALQKETAGWRMTGWAWTRH